MPFLANYTGTGEEIDNSKEDPKIIARDRNLQTPPSEAYLSIRAAILKLLSSLLLVPASPMMMMQAPSTSR